MELLISIFLLLPCFAGGTTIEHNKGSRKYFVNVTDDSDSPPGDTLSGFSRLGVDDCGSKIDGNIGWLIHL